MTEWTALALSGTISFSVLSVIEKVILSRWFNNSRSFCFAIGLIQVIIGLIVYACVPFSLEIYGVNYIFACIYDTGAFH